MEGLPNEDLAKLAGILRERAGRADWPLINRETLPDWIGAAPAHPAEAADRLLLNLASKSSETAVFTSLSSREDRSLAFAAATDSFVGLLEFLANEGWIELRGKREDKRGDLSFRVTLRGWRRVQSLRKSRVESDRVFVAMAFRPGTQDLWTEAIKPGIEAVGLHPIRADQEHHNERIDDWIMNQIRAARLVVVDTSQNNPGALFEAGYTLGLGRPVVWLAEQTHRQGGLHFDIRQYNHLAWVAGQEAALRPLLEQRLQSTFKLP